MFAANARGKCSLIIGQDVGYGEFERQVAQHIADTRGTCHLTPDADCLKSYEKWSRSLDLAVRRKIAIAGYGDLTLAFRFNESWVHVQLHDVPHAPLLSYNRISLTSLAPEDHLSAVEESGVTLKP